MKVKRNTLLFLAFLVWSVAGFNILRIGLMAYPAYRSAVNYLLSVLVFAVFQKFILENWSKSILRELMPTRMNGSFFSSSLTGKHLLLWQ